MSEPFELQNLTKVEMIDIANEIWGEQTWNYAVINETIDFIEANDGIHSVGVAAFIKVQTESGVYREELGYAIANKPFKGLAIYEARRNAILNGLYEAFIGFGGVLAKRLLDTQSKPSTSPTKFNRNSKLPTNLPLETAPAQLGSLVLEADMFTQDFNSNSIIEKAQNGKTVVKMERSSTPTKQTKGPIAQLKNDKVSEKQFVQELNKAGQSTDSCPAMITSTPFSSSEIRSHPAKNLFIAELPKPTGTASVQNLTDEKARAERLKRQKELREEFLRKRMKP